MPSTREDAVTRRQLLQGASTAAAGALAHRKVPPGRVARNLSAKPDPYGFFRPSKNVEDHRNRHYEGPDLVANNRQADKADCGVMGVPRRDAGTPTVKYAIDPTLGSLGKDNPMHPKAINTNEFAKLGSRIDALGARCDAMSARCDDWSGAAKKAGRIAKAVGRGAVAVKNAGLRTGWAVQRATGTDPASRLKATTAELKAMQSPAYLAKLEQAQGYGKKAADRERRLAAMRGDAARADSGMEMMRRHVYG